MAVPSGVARTRNIGTGSTGPFAFNYVLYDETHVTVIKTDLSGIDTVLTLTTDYSVTLATDFSSASVTLVSALAGDGIDDGGSEILTITRDPPIEQLIEWPRNDPFPSITHERAADLAVMMAGRLDEKVGRSLLLPESSTLTGLKIPPPLAGAAIGWNPAEDNLANVSVPAVYSQASEPTGVIVLNSLWIDSDSTDLDLYKYNGSAWVDTGVNLKGSTGATGATGAAGANGLFAGTEAQVSAAPGDLIPLQDVSDSNNPKRAASSTVGAGKQTIWVPAQAITPRTTNGPSVGVLELSTNKVMVSTLDFDSSVQEFAQFPIQMPKGWDEGTFTFRAVWSHAATATNFGVLWTMRAVALSNDDAADAAFGSGNNAGADTGGTTNDIYIANESGAVTIGGSPAEGDIVIFEIFRDATNGSDTLAIDARLHGVSVFYTTNANTDD